MSLYGLTSLLTCTEEEEEEERSTLKKEHVSDFNEGNFQRWKGAFIGRERGICQTKRDTSQIKVGAFIRGKGGTYNDV